MIEYIKSYKIRVYPSKEQIRIFDRNCGACRWVYNNFIIVNGKRHKNKKPYLSGYDYSKKLTKWKKEDPDYMWLNENEISSKAVHEAFMDADTAFRRFFKGISGYPKIKNKKRNPVNSYFFVGDNVKFTHNKVKLPILGNVRIKENNYVPKDVHIMGGTLSCKNGKYYATFRIREYKEEHKLYETDYTPGIGIDVGVKTYITGVNTLGDKFTYPKFIADKIYLHYEERIKNFQRIISKKMEINLNHLVTSYMDKHNELPDEETLNKMKGKGYSNSCRRLQKKINKLKEKQRNYKKDKVDKYVASLAKLKPVYITIEDLSVKELLENNESKTLHKYIQECMFRCFYTKLEFKCLLNGIELRKANKKFPSTKKCCICGEKNKTITLNDRVFKCKCGNELDRDLNAAINLCNLEKYEIVV